MQLACFCVMLVIYGGREAGCFSEVAALCSNLYRHISQDLCSVYHAFYQDFVVQASSKIHNSMPKHLKTSQHTNTLTPFLHKCVLSGYMEGIQCVLSLCKYLVSTHLLMNIIMLPSAQVHS